MIIIHIHILQRKIFSLVAYGTFFSYVMKKKFTDFMIYYHLTDCTKETNQ